MKNILRSIAFVPSFFVAYAIANLIQNFAASEWMPADAVE